ncbi:DNA cytosine methyltransferase [Streptomyces sp. NRRL F-2664]|uniref:DNA cytosine methyltransferase n=1 Tax=Streptomyces sp. NRRL F-2664 TaxID=1463842 RepID=UPI000A5CE9F5|nr:DNA cytosine methyltransferase [Streptomyces sp. NRRL F-2664]
MSINLSLCSGYGGLDLAVEQITGNKTTVYAENDPYAAQVMAARFPRAVNLGDITKIDWAALAAQHQIVTLSAGFPCQGLSNAGLRKGLLDARSALWTNVAQAVRVIRPRLVFLENVAAIRSRGLGEVLAELAAIGYDARWTCVRAGDPAVGAPHPRDRWFLIAYPTAQDPDSAAWRERWAAAPGQAEGGRTRADAGGRSGVPAAGAAGEDGVVLMSTPTVADARGTRNFIARRTPGKPFNAGKTLTDIAWLLPADFERGRWITSEGADYGPAIHRWTVITGRPAPAPSEPGARGNRRLTPRFVEWLMGCADGWVTDLDLPRNQQLKILGNGVVTRQAVEGYRRLLCADLDAMAA